MKKSTDSDRHEYSMNAIKVNQERGQLDYFQKWLWDAWTDGL